MQEARATTGEAYRQYQRIKPLEAEGTAAKSLLDERKRKRIPQRHAWPPSSHGWPIG